MRDLLGGHAMGFNKRHGRTGHLFGERFHHVHIAHHEQMLATIRYVALNPVRAGLVTRPEDWPWSSHAALMNGAMHPGTIDARALLGLFADDDAEPWEARRELSRYITGGLPEALVEARMRAA
jgi:hypothetical protein